MCTSVPVHSRRILHLLAVLTPPSPPATPYSCSCLPGYPYRIYSRRIILLLAGLTFHAPALNIPRIQASTCEARAPGGEARLALALEGVHFLHRAEVWAEALGAGNKEARSWQMLFNVG